MIVYGRTLSTTPLKLNEQLSAEAIPTAENTIQPVFSFNHEDSKKAEDESYENEIRMKILNASLPFVTELGWSRNAIAAGAEYIGYPGVIHGLFPRGGAELVQYFYTDCNNMLANKLKADTEAKILPKEPSEVMSQAIEARLRMIIPFKSQWPQALALMALPQNVPSSLANLLTLSDDICYYSGDRSVDITWYGRRIGLAAIYKMTELYFIQDDSHDNAETWSFLTQRLSEAVALNSILNKSEVASQQAKETLSSAMIMARNMLGITWNR